MEPCREVVSWPIVVQSWATAAWHPAAQLPTDFKPRHIGDGKRASMLERASPHRAELDCRLQCEIIAPYVAVLRGGKGRRHRGEDEHTTSGMLIWHSDESARLGWREDRHAVQRQAIRLLVARPVAWVAARSINNAIHLSCALPCPAVAGWLDGCPSTR